MSFTQWILTKIYNRTFLPIFIKNQKKQLPSLIAQLQKVKGNNYELQEILDVIRKDP